MRSPLRLLVPVALLISGLSSLQVARADDLFVQHRKLMLQSMQQCTPETTRKLLGTPYVDANDPAASYLVKAIEYNCPDAVRMKMLGVLLDAGADPNLAEAPENPLLLKVFRSFHSGYLAVVQLLVQRNLRLVPLFLNSTYLHVVNWPGAFAEPVPFSDVAAIFDYLIAHGADPQRRNAYGRNAMVANVLRLGSVEQTAYLLGKGVDVNAVDGCSMTAVDYSQLTHIAGNNYVTWASHPAIRAKNPVLAAHADALFVFLKAHGATIRHLPDGIDLNCVVTTDAAQ